MTTAGATATPGKPPRIDETLRREAERKIGPILSRAPEKGLGTVMYLAVMELQRSYPALRPHELESLLQLGLKTSHPS